VQTISTNKKADGEPSAKAAWDDATNSVSQCRRE